MFYLERLGGKQLASTKFLKHANFASHVTDYILAEIYTELYYSSVILRQR